MAIHTNPTQPTTCDKDILHNTVLSFFSSRVAFTHSPQPITFRLRRHLHHGGRLVLLNAVLSFESEDAHTLWSSS